MWVLGGKTAGFCWVLVVAPTGQGPGDVAHPGPLFTLLSLNIFLHCAVQKKKNLQMPFLWLRVSEVFLDQTQIFKVLLSGIQRNPEGFLLGERRELKSGLRGYRKVIVGG